MADKQPRLNIRIRQNQYKRVVKAGTTYKSIMEELQHDLRFENTENGYLRNPQKGNLYMVNDKIYHNNEELDIEEIFDNHTEWLIKAKEDYKKNNANKTWQKKSKPFITGIMTFKEYFDIPEEERETFMNIVKDFLIEQFGHYLTISMHRDEKSLHIHWTMINYNFHNKKTVGRNVVGEDLQTDWYEFLKARNATYGHLRGISKKETKAKHLEVMASKKIEEEKLIAEIEQLKEEKAELKKSNDSLMEQNHLLNIENQELQLEVNMNLETLEQICEDIISMGEEEKGKNILATAIQYFNANQNVRFNKLFNNAIKTLEAVRKKKAKSGQSIVHQSKSKPIAP